MNSNFSKRLKILLFLSFFFFLLLLGRLFYIQIIDHSRMKNFGEREFKKTITEITPRGKIYDCNGEILADSIVVWDLVAMKKEIENLSENIAFIGKTLGKNPSELKRKIDRAKNYVKLEKKIEIKQYETIKNWILENDVKGFLFEPYQKRAYPQESAKEVLGLANQENGLSGLELIYDKKLKGSVKIKEVLRDRRGNTIFSGKEEESEKPSEIYLTIDSKIQFFTEEIVKKYTLDSQGEMGIAIVQEVKTGKISAMASYPQNYINLMPVEWVYEPGSTMKTMILAAALEENIIDENDVYYCENGTWKFNSKATIKDHEPEKNLTVSEVFEKSSNIGFAKIGLKMGIEKMYEYLKSFSFGSLTGIGLNGESKGLIKELKNYKQIDTAVTSFGHSIAVTPLQLINSYTAIANNGTLLKPYLVEKIKSEKTEIINQKNEIRKVISEKTAKRVTKLMERVVDMGTGRNAQIIGYSVAGKTGTSNKIDPKTGKYISKKNVTSFCGFFPASEPKYSILVIIDAPKKFHYGGETAAPAFREIAKRIINIKNIKPDRNINFKEIKKASYKQTISD